MSDGKSVPYGSLILCACVIGFFIPYCQNQILDYINDQNEQLLNKFEALEEQINSLQNKSL